MITLATKQDRLRAALTMQGMAAKELALALEVSPAALSNYAVRQKTHKDAEIARILGVDEQWLVDGTGTPPPWAQPRQTLGTESPGKGERGVDQPAPPAHVPVSPARSPAAPSSGMAEFEAWQAQSIDKDVDEARHYALVAEVRSLGERMAVALAELRREVVELRRDMATRRSPAATVPAPPRLADLAATLPPVRGTYQIDESTADKAALERRPAVAEDTP